MLARRRRPTGRAAAASRRAWRRRSGDRPAGQPDTASTETMCFMQPGANGDPLKKGCANVLVTTPFPGWPGAELRRCTAARPAASTTPRALQIEVAGEAGVFLDVVEAQFG